ncbi:MAG TPA: GNAT family N-acetyltransferase [Geothrix sp.]|nr:GNAT family N-acetyltransferase [Geothrix sp.]
MDSLDIRLIPTDELSSILPLVALQNPKVELAELGRRLEEMKGQGYRCVGAYLDGALVGCAGLWLITKFYVGRHLEPDNVAVHPDHRGQKIGERLMDWIHAYAKEQGCVALELNCYMGNTGGHRFWHNQGYRMIGMHYQRGLVDPNVV